MRAITKKKKKQANTRPSTIRLSKKQEQEARKVYAKYWDSYTKGDIRGFSSTLGDGFEMIGTSETEVCHSKKEGIAFYKAQMKELVGRAEMRNRHISVKPVNGMFLFNETADIYILEKRKWTYYSRIRISTLLHETQSGWKVIQQHGSFPDMRVQEGETIAFEKISKENLALRDAINRATAELNTKNRDLEIESALEKVRSVAMGMRQRDDMLSICKTISQQLAKLGVKEIRNVQTAIFYPNRGTYMNYQFYAKSRKTFITDTDYTDHKIPRAFAAKMLKGRGQASITHIEGKQKMSEWIRYQQGTNVFIDPWLHKFSSLHYYWYSLGPVALGISTYQRLPKEDENLFQRFLNVFELAYRRYLDIEKAEAQAREAQIQLALERVRARAMAMHSSNELIEASAVLFHELKRLGIKTRRSGFGIYNEEQQSIQLWLTAANDEVVETSVLGNIPLDAHPAIRENHKAWKENRSIMVHEFYGKQVRNYYGKIGPYMSLTPQNEYPQKLIFSVFYFSEGSLNVMSDEPLTEDEKAILVRFANTFDLTYRRFLDLQKAEAQAREAQIEAALEKVRSRSLAMHKSDELKEVVAVLYQKLQELDFEMDKAAALVMTFMPGTNDLIQWITDATQTYAVPFFIPFTDHTIARNQLNARKKGLEFYSSLYNKKEKNGYFKYLFQHTAYKQIPDEVKKMILGSKNFGISIAFEQNSAIAIPSSIGKLVSGDEINILKRFAKVFEQSYTRFLDLQKAEAQAREGQIQLALERVRARSMAMHHSDEITDVVKLLYKEFDNLKLSNESTDIEIGLIDEKTGVASIWAHFYLSDGSISTFQMPLDHFTLLRNEYRQWKSTPSGKRKELFITSEFSQKQFKQFMKEAEALPELQEIFGPLKEADIKKWVTHNAYFSHGLLTLQGVDHYSAETQDIQKRFAKVFEQTYTRFLDLQKAEAQAREAQIEAALEKVRSRSMAMQQPEELIEVAELLRREMGLLGVEELETSSIYIIDHEKKKAECWYAIKDVRKENAQLISDEMTLILTDTWVGKEMWKFYQSANDQVSILMKGERRRAWINYCAEHSKVLKGYYGDEIPERTYHLVKFNGGYMGAASPGDISKESWDLLKRAAVVFSLAYTRFKDLQDAAARAREAQIELALERVRSRSMAMHKSEELKEVIKVVLEQFVHLNINAEHAGFYIDYKTHNDMHIWLADPNIEPFYAVIPYFDTPTWNSFLEAKEKGTILHTDLLDFKAKNKFYKSLFKLFTVPEEAKQFYMQCKGLAVSTVLLDSVGLYIENFSAIPYTDEENNILIRFGKVFQQSYTRFLDLQKAEAQAREAQIEAALERIRSRSLAMHHSSELSSVVDTLLQEFTGLNFSLTFCIINLIDGDDLSNTVWAANPETGKDAESYYMKFEDYDFHRAMWKAWKAQDKRFVYILEGEEKKIYDEYLFTETEFRRFPKHVQDANKALERYVAGFTFFKYSGLQTVSVNPITEQELAILERFGNVFEQAYTRFLDLQKAEAQAREAQIEAALEKVRSRLLAMHKPDELNDVVIVIVEKLKELGVILDANGITLCTYFPDSKDVQHWIASPDFSMVGKYLLPYFDHIIFREAWESKESGEPYFSKAYSVEEKNSFFDHAFQYSDYQFFPEEFKQWIYQNDKHTLSFAWQKNSALLIPSNTGIEPSEVDKAVLIRFSKVFEQAYIRFMDLQKAEALARETQINLAVERVRAKALAMHNSSQIFEVVVTLRDEMMGLNIPGVVAATIYLQEEDGYIRMWDLSSAQEKDAGFKVELDVKFKLEETDPGLYIRRVWNNKAKYFIETQDKKDMAITLQWLRQYYPEQANETEKFLNEHPWKLVHHATIQLANGKMSVDLLDVEPPEEMKNILSKMGSAFDLAYKRFEDLQKAEAQARENQVQLALEKVRSQAMAMQQSGDLLDIVVTMRNEFVQLGYEAGYFWYMRWLPEKYEKAMTSGDGTRIGTVIELPRRIHGDIPSLAAWEKSNEPTVVHVMNVEQTLDYVHKMAEWGDFKQVDPNMPTEEDIHHIGGLTYVMARTQHGEIGYSLAGMVPDPPDEAVNTLIRFAKVFDLAYRRFEDLMVKEEKNRETQIELAMERVRTKTMAMQHSDELPEAANILFLEVQKLGIPSWSCGYNILSEDKKSSTCIMSSEGQLQIPFTLPLTEHESFLPWYEAILNNEEFFVYQQGGGELEEHYSYMKTLPELKPVFKQFDDAGLSLPTFQINHLARFKQGFLLFITYEPVPEAHTIFKRFAKLFDQTYTRFLDLQKAEAQAREAQIEAALERVRSRSMAMHKSEELADLSLELVKQVQALGVKTWFCAFNIYDDDPQGSLEWGSNGEGTFPRYRTPREGVFLRYYEAGQRGETLFINEIGEDECPAHYEYLCSLPGVGEQLLKMKAAGISFPTFQIDHVAYFKYGYIIFITYEPVPESHDIFKRFAKVFEQTYTRFLDLQKAEAQAREAKIEYSLERVRAEAMAMHKSEELLNVCRVMYNELIALGFEDIRNAMIHTFNDENDYFLDYDFSGDAGGKISRISTKSGIGLLENYLKEIKKSTDAFLEIIVSGEELENWKQFRRLTHQIDHPRLEAADKIYYYYYSIGMGDIGISTFSPISKKQLEVLERFRNVFQLSYQRYVDIKNAEAQAREAQIEASLERVRAKAMAMHISNDLNEAIAVVFEELEKLDLGMQRCGIGIINSESRTVDVFSTAKTPHGNIIQVTGNEPMDLSALLHGALEAWLRNEKEFSYVLKGQELVDYYKSLEKTGFILPDSLRLSEEDKSRGQHYYTALTNHGGLYAFCSKEFTVEAKKVMLRFADVFNLTYQRFLDLQKAEAQARESEIQLALERVRASTAAMHKSEELIEVINTVFQQLQQLHFTIDAASLSINYKEDPFNYWMAISGHPYPSRISVPYTNIEFMNRLIADSKKGKSFFAEVFNKEEKDDWVNHILEHTIVKNVSDERKKMMFAAPGLALSVAIEKNIALTIANYAMRPFKDEENAIIKRFANVFEQTYTRFLDLMKAEAQAKEAQVENALEKVRSRTLAMQRSDELAETAAVLFQQLIQLGIEPNRLYIGITSDNSTDIEFWITDEDGSKISTMFKGNAEQNTSLNKMYDAWKQNQKSIVIDMQGKELEDYFHYLGEELHVPFKGGLSQKRRWQYIAYFSKGFIGMASPEEQPEENLQLLERFAYAFNLTFTRFSDLKIAEAHALQAEQDLVEIKAARKKAEDTLSELQAAQKQLIQSEKMASLGELTAGIAHEIQNPLNFVNNFSEVSKELLDEMKEELTKGHNDEASQIANDLIQNLEKINYHGKRADGIVKGMLQHSRSSSGQKELIDINVLADEYLRLAYHGLRAKDKSFNAKFETSFDNNIEKINVVPQDIGRVILNLINNAFYAVSEKKKDQLNGYEPVVIVSTKKMNDKIQVIVKDNGNGIPESIKEKIFQPFFTTKPTGEGTGLGLSLSYDIIKAHGGELKMETEQGVGTIFIINLPVQ